MAETTAIEWTQATYNPWHGCKKVSPGCKNCYMYREKKAYGQDPMNVVKSSPSTFNAPLKWKEPKLIFTCSWSDFFIQEADEWRDETWDIIRRTPHHTYQILTKRPERIKDHLPADWGEGWDNVWLGVSVETQEYVRRVFELGKIPARVRFVSAEPLLGPIDFNQGNLLHLPPCPKSPLNNDLWNHLDCDCREYHPKWLDWVIVGGESGPGARPMHPKWVTDIRDQCQGAGIKFFMKQWGEWIPRRQIATLTDFGWQVVPEWQEAIKGKEWGTLVFDGAYWKKTTTWNGREQDPRDNYEGIIYRVGKKAAGRLLDGREWNEFPEVQAVEE